MKIKFNGKDGEDVDTTHNKLEEHSINMFARVKKRKRTSSVPESQSVKC